jgi:hypothetical protein
MPYTDDEIVQFIVQTTRGTARLRRTSDGGATWYDLYMNPRLVAGKEYATTETSNDEIVYVKKVVHTFTSEFGDDSSSKDYAIGHGISDFGRLVRIDITDGTYVYPYFNNAGGTISVKSVDAYNVHIRCNNADRTVPVTFNIDLYYTKQ